MARYAALSALLVGALLLIVAEFLVVREIRAVTVVPPGGTTTGGELHDYALALVGVAVLPLTYAAMIRGLRPAMTALLVMALIAVWIVLVIDQPKLEETGLIGRTYDLAEARPGPGFYVEGVGAALVLAGAVGALVLGPLPRPRVSRS